MAAALIERTVNHMSEEKKICFVSSIPITILCFYGKLLKRLQSLGWQHSVMASEAPELKVLNETYGAKGFVVNITRNISPLKDLLAIYSAFIFFLKNKYDIVHVHTPKGGLVGILASFFARVPVRIYTMHGLPLETASGLKKKLLWLAEKITCGLATHILAVSPSLRERVIEERLCSPEKLSILGNGTACGIDLARFLKNQALEDKAIAIRRELGIPESDLVIGFVGRITPEKGVHTLVRSFQNIEKRKKVSLLLVGDLDTVRENISSDVLGLIDNHKKIFMAGHQSDPVPYYVAMDIFVMPTRREGFGMTFIEANAMELPVIGCRVTGCVDAVDEGESGLLVEVDNEKELTNAIGQLIDDSDLRVRLGQKGKKRAADLFDSDLLVQEHIKLYDRLLKA